MSHTVTYAAASNMGTITLNTPSPTLGSTWDDGIFLTGSVGQTVYGRGRDRKPRKPRTPSRRPDPSLPNIFITNRKTGRTKTFHSSLEAIAFLWGKDLSSFIIVKDILTGVPATTPYDPESARVSFNVIPESNDLNQLQTQLDLIV